MVIFNSEVYYLECIITQINEYWFNYITTLFIISIWLYHDTTIYCIVVLLFYLVVYCNKDHNTYCSNRMYCIVKGLLLVESSN